MRNLVVYILLQLVILPDFPSVLNPTYYYCTGFLSVSLFRRRGHPTSTSKGESAIGTTPSSVDIGEVPGANACGTGGDEDARRESAHLKLKTIHLGASVESERTVVARESLGDSVDGGGDETAAAPNGGESEGRSQPQEGRLPRGAALLMEYRPSEGGECFVSLGGDGSKLALFLDAAVRSADVAPRSLTPNWSHQSKTRASSADEAEAPERLSQQLVDTANEEVQTAVDTVVKGSGSPRSERQGTEDFACVEVDEAWLAKKASAISVKAGKWGPNVTVSAINVADEATRDSLKALWTRGRLLSQDRDAVDVLNGGERTFSDLLGSYTTRTKSNHWEEIPRERLLKVLERYHPEVISRCGHDPVRPVEETLSSLRDMLEWFRQEFPYYYDGCLSCGNRANNTFVGYVSPSDDERTFKAGRTELYHCSACGVMSRFARYTAVSKVLETQRGRCGEYSVVMLRFLEALGYTCRWVVDWSDHVWTEAFVDGRWVHVDPCEAAIDEPLLYESWGKNQTYIIAFTPHEVVDVTDRYTSDFEAAKARREIDDDALRMLIADATRTLQGPSSL